MYPQAGDGRLDDDNAKLSAEPKQLQEPLESNQLCKYDAHWTWTYALTHIFFLNNTIYLSVMSAEETLRSKWIKIFCSAK